MHICLRLFWTLELIVNTFVHVCRVGVIYISYPDFCILRGLLRSAHLLLTVYWLTYVSNCSPWYGTMGCGNITFFSILWGTPLRKRHPSIKKNIIGLQELRFQFFMQLNWTMQACFHRIFLNPISAQQCRQLIQCARRVSGINFIKYAQS